MVDGMSTTSTDRAPLWVIEHEPSRRFPVYTRGNAGEVYPNVMSPLTGSLIGDAASVGQIRALSRLGMLTNADVSEPGAVGTGVFGGYLYGNLSLMRVFCERAPGMSALDADIQMAGIATGAPPYRRRRGDRNVAATVRGTWVLSRNLFWPDISEVDEARTSSQRWRANLPSAETMTDGALIDLVRQLPSRFENGMAQLLYSSAFAGAGGAMLEQIAERTGSPTGTATALTAGLGTIDSAEPAIALWGLGRSVARSTALTRLFDEKAGLDDLAASRGDRDVDGFLAEFDRFIASHGARGPDEWELASPTWGSEPQIALAAIERLRQAPDARDPILAGRRLSSERERAGIEVRAALPRPFRRVFDRLLRAAQLHAAGRERAKAVFIHDVYPIRLALFELADRTSERGRPGDRSDFFLITIEELDEFVAQPTRFLGVIDERRRRRDELQARVPPFVFEGRIPDPSTWPLRDAAVDVEPTTRLTGMGVCPGVARGTVRIVHDPAEPGRLEPDDILVAPITDPAWTPLFLAVRGVVVEVGAQQSHAAIVSRELGIPAVVGVAGATRRLHDGEMIEIDGATGAVTVVGVV